MATRTQSPLFLLLGRRGVILRHAALPTATVAIQKAVSLHTELVEWLDDATRRARTCPTCGPPGPLRCRGTLGRLGTPRTAPKKRLFCCSEHGSRSSGASERYAGI